MDSKCNFFLSLRSQAGKFTYIKSAQYHYTEEMAASKPGFCLVHLFTCSPLSLENQNFMKYYNSEHKRHRSETFPRNLILHKPHIYTSLELLHAAWLLSTQIFSGPISLNFSSPESLSLHMAMLLKLD